MGDPRFREDPDRPPGKIKAHRSNVVIEIVKLVKNYKKVEALKGVDLSVAGGELFSYLGPNGAGKTTTIRILTGLTRLTSGRAYLNGHDITRGKSGGKKTVRPGPPSTSIWTAS